MTGSQFRQRCILGATCLAVIALALPGFAQEPAAGAPGPVPALQQPVDADRGAKAVSPQAGGEKPDGALDRRLQALEQQMGELRLGMARLQDRVSPAAQPQTSAKVEERLGQLEQQNQEDHRAIWDLYDRLQRLEEDLARTRTELNQRIGALSEANAALRQQLSQSQAREDQRKKAAAGYPGINQIVIDKDGRRYIQYEQ